jgi:hypothetical protein
MYNHTLYEIMTSYKSLYVFVDGYKDDYTQNEYLSSSRVWKCLARGEPFKMNSEWRKPYRA